jgi:uncharacterized membrane protein
MKKRRTGFNQKHPTKHNNHPVFRERLTSGQRAADVVAKFGGSWTFIGIFMAFLVIWMIVNTVMILKNPFDPYPYILLNLVLSCVAAIQAPIILMAENRQMERDRIDANYDHAVNRKAEREIQGVQRELESIRRMVTKMHKEQIKKLESRTKSVIRKIEK